MCVHAFVYVLILFFCYWFVFFCLPSFFRPLDFSHCLRLVEVRIPNYVVKGSAAQLECLYDLDGESLYSVKWYKDGNEFYRYVPRDMPPAQTFLLPGVSVDVSTTSIRYIMSFYFFRCWPLLPLIHPGFRVISFISYFGCFIPSGWGNAK